MPKNKVISHKSYVISFKKIAFLFFIFTYYLQLMTYYCFAQDKFIYDAKGKRDPFIPLVTPEGRLLKLDTEETKGPLVIEGIIYDEKGLSYAIVNGAIVKIGDMIEGYQVLKIEKDKVIFIKEGNISELELLKKEAE